MNLLDNDWLNSLWSIPIKTGPCDHVFVTSVVKDFLGIYQPETWMILDNAKAAEYPHDHIAAVPAKQVFCVKCQIKGNNI